MIQFYDPNNYQPEKSVAFLMKQILLATSQQVESLIEHTGLTDAQWIPVFKLLHKQPCTAAELARECNLDAGAMTRKLDRLEAKGLIQRQRSETDRRIIFISLTSSGVEAAQQIPQLLSTVQNAHLADFSKAEFEQFSSYLQRILKNARNFSSDEPIQEQK